MDANKNLIDYRGVLAEDLNFILSTWKRGLKYGNETFGFMDDDVYYDVYGKAIEAICLRPTIKIKVACLKSEPDVILGYSVIEGKTIHWIFVKPAWRKIGIAKELMPENFDTVSHITRVGKSILAVKFPTVKFNPFK